MHLIPSDPDVQTLVNRIRSGDIDLQPDFQRGEVWTQQKKRRLIDSILRNWHVPPIHLVVNSEGKEEVLDGHQRLASIRDFANGLITVDGKAEPKNEAIRGIDGYRYEQLPDNFRRTFDRFSIRVIRIEDYLPEETGELFYRLNQPTNLTAAEHRNAFFGYARQQVKTLVQQFNDSGITKESIGFSNSRMSYDDVIARFCYTLHLGTLRQKITATDVTAKFREKTPFSDSAISRAQASLRIFGKVVADTNMGLKFNKATLYSWLCFFSALDSYDNNISSISSLGSFIHYFEALRSDIRIGSYNSVYNTPFASIGKPLKINSLIALFNDRASSRVNDVSSVLIRDFLLWTFFFASNSINTKPNKDNIDRLGVICKFLEYINGKEDPEYDFVIERFLEGWGELA